MVDYFTFCIVVVRQLINTFLYFLEFVYAQRIFVCSQHQFKRYRVSSSSYWETSYLHNKYDWLQKSIVGRCRSIVKQLGHPIISEHTITLHFDRYIYSRNYFGNFILNLNYLITFYFRTFYTFYPFYWCLCLLYSLYLENFLFCFNSSAS